MCGGVRVGIHVCVRELHMRMEARGQPQLLSVLGAMYFIFSFFETVFHWLGAHQVS